MAMGVICYGVSLAWHFLGDRRQWESLRKIRFFFYIFYRNILYLFSHIDFFEPSQQDIPPVIILPSMYFQASLEVLGFCISGSTGKKIMRSTPGGKKAAKLNQSGALPISHRMWELSPEVSKSLRSPYIRQHSPETKVKVFEAGFCY